jgi:hypothetical protein
MQTHASAKQSHSTVFAKHNNSDVTVPTFFQCGNLDKTFLYETTVTLLATFCNVFHSRRVCLDACCWIYLNEFFSLFLLSFCAPYKFSIQLKKRRGPVQQICFTSAVYFTLLLFSLTWHSISLWKCTSIFVTVLQAISAHLQVKVHILILHL